MIYFLLAICGIFLTVFFEHIFLGLFTFSIFLLVVINLWNRWNSKLYIFFATFTGVALDTTLHLPLGFNIFFIGIVLFFLAFLQILLPLEKANVRYVTLFFVFFVAYLLRFVLLYVLQDSVLPNIELSYILNSVIVSIFSVLLCLLFDRVLLSLRDSNSYEKIRLK